MKKIIYILLGLALAALVVITALVKLIDPNEFKPQLVEQVRKSTGRELVMEGDIGLVWVSPTSGWRFATRPVLPSRIWCASSGGMPRSPCYPCSPIDWTLAR